MNAVHKTCTETAAVSRGTSHATTNEHDQYTTSVDINNMRFKRMQSLIQNHMQHELCVTTTEIDLIFDDGVESLGLFLFQPNLAQ